MSTESTEITIIPNIAPTQETLERVLDGIAFGVRVAETSYDLWSQRGAAQSWASACAAFDLRDMSVRFANLVATAEREIVKRNPPLPVGRPKSADGRPIFSELPEGVTPGQMRHMRQAHANVSDQEFEEAKIRARDTGEPITQRQLQVIGRKSLNQRPADIDQIMQPPEPPPIDVEEVDVEADLRARIVQLETENADMHRAMQGDPAEHLARRVSQLIDAETQLKKRIQNLQADVARHRTHAEVLRRRLEKAQKFIKQMESEIAGG